MSDCPICHHAKAQAINDALHSGRSPNLVRAQYRLERQMLDDHIAHHTAPMQGSRSNAGCVDTRNHLLDQALTVFEDPLRRVTYHLQEAAHAWSEVESGRRTPERLQLILQEAFQSDGMGL